MAGRNILDQMHLGVAAEVLLGPGVLRVAVPSVEVGSLERVRGDDHLGAPSRDRLGLRRREQLAPQAGTTHVRPDPEELDVAAASPGPPGQASLEAPVRTAAGDTQRTSVIEARGLDVELVDKVRERVFVFLLYVAD